MKIDLMEVWARACIRNNTIVLLITTVVTLLAALCISRLQVVIDPSKMLPASHPFVQTRPLLENTFGEKYALMISLTPSDGDIHQQHFLKNIELVTQELQNLKGVVHSTLLTPTHTHAKAILGSEDGFAVRPLKQSLSNKVLFDRWLTANPIYQDTLVSNDKKSLAIIARFDPDPEGYNAILSRVEPVLARLQKDGSVNLRLTGHVEILGEMERYSMRMLWLIPLAILLVGLVHFEAFRSWQGMILPLVTATLSMIWVLGLFGAAGVPLDVFNSATPILVLAVAAGHAVQILKRFVEEYVLLRETTMLSPQDANVEAVVRALVKVGPLMLAAGAIAGLGFFSLMVFEMGSVRVFGVLTGLGILSALAIELTFIPALRSRLQPPLYPITPKRSIWPFIINAIIRVVRWRGLLPCAVIFVASAGIGASRVQIDNSNRANFALWTDIRKQDNFVNDHFAGSQLLYVAIDTGKSGGALNPEVLRGIDRIQQGLLMEPGVGKTLSLADYLKRMQQAMHNDNEDEFTLPASADLAAQYILLYENSGDAEDLTSFIDDDQQKMLIKIMVKQDDSRYIEALVDKVRNLSSLYLPPSVKVGYGGGVADAAAINEVLARDKLQSIAQIMAAVFVLSGLFFRSVTAAFLVLLPLAIAVISTFGVLGWSGIPLNIPTSLIAPMAVGIGADYSIYLLARFREEAEKSSDDIVILNAVLSSAGTACLYVASAVAAGYGVLAFSFGFRVHQWMALLIANAMLVSALSALLLVSIVVLRLRPKFIFKDMV